MALVVNRIMRFTTKITAALLAVLCAAPALAQNDTSLNNQYAKLKKAYWKTDYRQAISFFGSNFTWVKPMGEKVGYTEFAAGLRRLFNSPGMHFNVVDMKNDSVNVTGDEAMVRSDKKLQYTQHIDGRNVTSTITMATVDTWRRSPAGWKLFKIQVLSQSEQNSGS